MNTIKQSFITIIICLVILTGVNLVYAWTGPPGNPPDPNAPAPINVSNVAQQKTGTLRVGGLTTDYTTNLATISGNVGIGTTGPGNKLEVSGGNIKILTAQSKLIFDHDLRYIQGVQTGGADYLTIAEHSFAAGIQLGFANAASAPNYPFYPTMTITSASGASGNVGIGTANPGTKLDVVGTVKMTGFQLGTAATVGHVLTTNASGVGTWQVAAGGGITSINNMTGPAITISGGNGITISNGSNIVTVSANTTQVQSRVTGTCAAGSSIRVINADGTVSCEIDDVGAAGGITCSGSCSSGNIPKFTGASSVANSQIYDNGTNVGIGTASPSGNARVTISSPNFSTAALYWGVGESPIGFLGVRDGNTALIGTHFSANNLIFRAGNADRMIIKNDNSIGWYNISNTQVGFLGYNGNDALVGANASVGGDLRLRAGNMDVMFIKGSTGNVGIGTASPAQKLDVQGGNIRTSGQIFTQNLGALPNGWGGIHTYDVHARNSIRTHNLCLGGGFNGDGVGDCRSAWPGGGALSCTTVTCHSSSCTAICPADRVVTGCSVVATSGSGATRSYFSGNGCYGWSTVDPVTVQARCCRIQ